MLNSLKRFWAWIKSLFGKAEKEVELIPFYTIRVRGSNVGGHRGNTMQEALEDFAKAQTYIENDVRKAYSSFAEFLQKNNILGHEVSLEKQDGV